MSTPDSHDQQSAGNRGDSTAGPLLRTTTWTEHRSGAFERILYKVNSALRPLIAARLSEEHSLLFADPLADPETGEVSWYSPIEGEVVAYVDLKPEDQPAVDRRVNKLLFNMMELARKLQAEPKTLEDFVMGQLLELQLDSSYSQKECLYLVGRQPVFAFWAFESGQSPAAFPLPATTSAKREAARQQQHAPADAATRRARARPRPTFRLPKLSASTQQLALAAGVLAIIFIGLFGVSPQSTVIAWLDRYQTIRAHEEALLRIIARDERARLGGGVSPQEIEAELEDPKAAPAVEVPPEAAEVPVIEEVEPEPPPPFETTKGALSVDQVPGSILILHFWSATDANACGEITSFVSMVTSEAFDSVRELGGEAYLVTNAGSLDQGNEILKACGVQDPFPLRDPDSIILSRLTNAKPPLTVIYDKLTDRVLATYPRRNWYDAMAIKELQKLFLMQAF